MSRLVHFCSRVQLHLLLQKGRLINSESALFVLDVPSVLFTLTTGNRLSSLQQILYMSQRKRGVIVANTTHMLCGERRDELTAMARIFGVKS